jgi:hypothetical protein
LCTSIAQRGESGPHQRATYQTARSGARAHRSKPGVVYGYDLSNITGALLLITDEFGLTMRQQELVTTAVVLGEIAGALGAGMLANLIGRKWSMVLVAAGYAVFALLGAMSDSVSMLLVARLLLGLTIGVSVVVVPVFVAESAPAAVRGSLLVGYQVATVFGIIVGYLACYLLAEESGGKFVEMLRRPYFRATAFVLSGIGTMIAADALLIVVFAARLAAIFGFIRVLLFTTGFTFGFGALVWVYAGESFPSRLRSMGSSAMLTANLLANAMVAGLFLTLLHSLGGAGTFAVFGVFAVGGFAFVHRFAPETKGRQLEEIRDFWENNGRWPDELPSATTDVQVCR